MATVDVLMPVREPAPWLQQSLTGLAAQHDADWRLVLVVHGDDTTTIESVRRTGVPHVVCRVAADRPFPEVLDEGLARCTAPFVARMDADDVALPGRLSVTCARLVERPEAAVVASWAELIDDSGRVSAAVRRVSGEGRLVRGMRWHNVVVHSSVTFRREVIVGLGGYSTDATHVEDYDLWLRVLAHSEIEVIPQVLVQHRVHVDQVTRRRAVPASSAEAISSARLALARARGESVLAARARQSVWAGLQAARRWRRD